jgi:hypothetical protein
MSDPKPSTSATPYSSISSSSFVDLKAELGSVHSSSRPLRHSRAPALSKLTSRSRKKQADLASTSSSHILGKRPSSSSKPSIFTKRNKGVASRARHDQLEEDLRVGGGGRDPDRPRKRLEEKSALYDKLKRGKTAGLAENQIEALLVDFDESGGGDSGTREGESEDEVDESLMVPARVVVRVFFSRDLVRGGS